MRSFLLGIALVSSLSVVAADLPDPTPAQIDEIISKFAAKEAEFQRARGNYTYRQTARVQELDDNGAVLGSVSADDVLAELAAARRATGGQTATDTDRPADRTAGATGRISR